MTEKQSSYRKIFKATSLFGGVQSFNIIISVIRSKLIAVLIGPAGMGIAGLLTATTGFIAAFTNFGLETSAVKNVAAADTSGDKERVKTTVTALRKLVWVTGMLGMIVTAILSPWLSRLTFGNTDYTLAFIWLSVTLLFKQLSNGQLVILQGLRKLKYLAEANVIGSVFGLLISIPLYYFWRIKGIVPVIILTSLTSMALSWYFARKVNIGSVKLGTRDTLSEGKDMLKMGFLLSLSGLIALAISYITRIYIRHSGGVEQVGLFNAGFMIINTYVGMVFTAMSTDYYPRLSAVAEDNQKAKELINQQAEIAILILAPILALFLIFIHQAVILLYSQKFLAVNEMIQWAALGMYFKAASWSIGFILLAKGASKVFFWNELISNIVILLSNITGYRLAGLQGLGISFLAAYTLYFIQIYFVSKIMYNFSFDRVFYKVAVIQLLIGFSCFAAMRIMTAPWTYIIGSALIVISAIYSLRELEKRIGLRSVIIKKIQTFLNH